VWLSLIDVFQEDMDMLRLGTLSAGLLALFTFHAQSARADTPQCLIDFGPITEHLRQTVTTVHDEPVGPSVHLGSHGQLIFGEDVVYLHHLPFLMEDPARHPHNFQVLMRVSFVDEADKQAYLERRQQAPSALFTALPAPFNQDRLRDFFENGSQGQELGEVSVFDEHFENFPEPQPFLRAGMVVDEVVQFSELLPKGPTAEELSYLIVESGEEAALVHVLSTPPDFDQVLQVTLTPKSAGSMALSLNRGTLRMLGASNVEAQRLRAGDAITCSAHDGTRRLPFEVAVTVEG
jgi:hypothetical protein